jgi:plasmid stabilization system protein ParE
MRPSYPIIISPEAAADLDAIYEFVARDSSSNADILVEKILAAAIACGVSGWSATSKTPHPSPLPEYRERG